jgi:hypothetical protein
VSGHKFRNDAAGAAPRLPRLNSRAARSPVKVAHNAAKRELSINAGTTERTAIA